MLYHIHRISRLSLVCLLAVMLTTSGCSFGSFVNIALQDLPVLVQIVTNILSIVAVAQGNGGISTSEAAQIKSIATQVKTDLTLVQTLVAQYQAADATSKPGIASEIDNALTAVTNNLNAILNAAHISNPTLQATITGAVTLALTTVLAIQSLVPAPVIVQATKTARVPVRPADAATLKRQWNAIAQSNGYGAYTIK
jgi:hypothetical protein